MLRARARLIVRVVHVGEAEGGRGVMRLAATSPETMWHAGADPAPFIASSLVRQLRALSAGARGGELDVGNELPVAALLRCGPAMVPPPPPPPA